MTLRTPALTRGYYLNPFWSYGLVLETSLPLETCQQHLAAITLCWWRAPRMWLNARLEFAGKVDAQGFRIRIYHPMHRNGMQIYAFGRWSMLDGCTRINLTLKSTPWEAIFITFWLAFAVLFTCALAPMLLRQGAPADLFLGFPIFGVLILVGGRFIARHETSDLIHRMSELFEAHEAEVI
jgi:hypothetical protein